MPIAWNADSPDDRPRIRDNLVGLLREIARQAVERRVPSIAMIQEWHRRIYEGIQLPVSYYAGGIRDSDPEQPELSGYDVRVGRFEGVSYRDVPQRLQQFETALRRGVALLDELIPPGTTPADVDSLHSMATLASSAHGELVRIHPFANGNGRVARLLANWSFLRYGIPPVLRLKPRPAGERYARAAAASMRGDHAPMIAVVLDAVYDWLAS